MKRTLLTVFLTLLAAGLLALAGAAVVVRFGLYDVQATTQHTQPVFSLLEVTLKNAVRVRAAGIETPPPAAAEAFGRGAACYRDHCAQCHGGPGEAPGAVGMSMTPVPGPLVNAVRRWHEREIYWITRHGIKMSGMPAWELRLVDAELWAIVGFIGRLPELSPADYRARLEAVRDTTCPTRQERGAAGFGAAKSAGETPAALAVEVADEASAEARARLVLRQYACVTCHTIPGTVGSHPQVGPPLDGMARRATIAGRLPNTGENMVRWLRAPQQVKPGTAMPDLGLTDAHARQIAAYLAKLY